MRDLLQIRRFLLAVVVAACTTPSISLAGVTNTAMHATLHRLSEHEPQETPQAPSQDQSKPPVQPISVESNLVVLDVLVTDDNGTVLGGLKKENFRLLDNGKPQIITHFAPTEEPITIVILMEYSGLAYDYFAYKAADWRNRFLNHLDSKDWVALVTYDMRPTIQVDFTRNKSEVQDALGSLSYPGMREPTCLTRSPIRSRNLSTSKGRNPSCSSPRVSTRSAAQTWTRPLTIRKRTM